MLRRFFPATCALWDDLEFHEKLAAPFIVAFTLDALTGLVVSIMENQFGYRW